MAGRISKQDLAQFGSSWEQLLAGLGQIFQQQRYRREVDQARQESTMGTPVDLFNRNLAPQSGFAPTNQGIPDPNLGMPQLDQAKFIQALLPLIARGNPNAQTAFQGTMATMPKFQALGADQTYGSVDPLNQKFTEQGKTPSRPLSMGMGGAPTQLYKHQQELEAIREANPDDPRIPEYEAVIKKLQIGVPNFQGKPGAEGQYLKFNSKTGEYEPSKGPQQYQPTPSQIRLAASQLQNVRQSAQKIKDIVGRANVTGPVTGRARKLGSRFFSDKDAQTLVSTIGQLRPIIYGLSGKQINEAEQEWLTNEILPSLSQPDENFDVTLEIFNNWVDQTLGNMKSQFPSLQIETGGTPGGKDLRNLFD